MKILFVSAEVAPLSKTGGLGDFAGALPKELAALGEDVVVATPLYKSSRDKLNIQGGGTKITTEVGGVSYEGTSFRLNAYDLQLLLISQEHLFDRDGIYGDESGGYSDNLERYAFFCKSLLVALDQGDWKPDIIHVNDWHASLIPILLKYEIEKHVTLAKTKTLLSIHNLAYQGNFCKSEFWKLGLPYELLSDELMGYHDCFSLLKGGIVLSDKLNTVSESYRNESLTEEFGMGLQGQLLARGNSYTGIINGIDYDSYNPSTDVSIPHNYSCANLGPKSSCKEALLAEFGLPSVIDKPLVGVVSRFTYQKGLDMLEHIWDELMKRDLLLITIGEGMADDTSFFRSKVGKEKNASLNLYFSEAIGRKIYAGADMILMPSRFEPCGLVQMMAMRYGAVPIVRRTGGLKDTIVNYDESADQPNGFDFIECTPVALLGAIDRALEVYKNRNTWGQIMRNGMKTDFSWRNSALKYLRLYSSGGFCR